MAESDKQIERAEIRIEKPKTQIIKPLMVGREVPWGFDALSLLGIETLQGILQSASQSAVDAIKFTGLDGLQPSIIAFQPIFDQHRRELQNILDSLGVMPTWGWPEPTPRRLPYTPEPEPKPKPLEVVQISDFDSKAILEAMIHQGRISPAEMVRIGLQFSDKAAPGRKRATWEEIEAICLDYERNGHKYPDQKRFAERHGISKSAFTQYRRIWRAARTI